jgi:hypothetical protein
MTATDTLVRAAKRLLEDARSARLILRLSGGLACWYRCYGGRQLSARSGRTYNDIDFVAHYHQKREIARLLRIHGYEENAVTATVPGARRTIFRNRRTNIGGDVFYDILPFNHTIDLRSRLDGDEDTIPLADLLLQKMQIVTLAEKDVIDVQMLLLDHDFRDDDKGINIGRIGELCGSNWGFYRTVQLNVEAMASITAASAYLEGVERARIAFQLTRLNDCIEEARKSLQWRVRSLVGDRIRWYATVDEHRHVP